MIECAPWALPSQANLNNGTIEWELRCSATINRCMVAQLTALPSWFVLQRSTDRLGPPCP